MSHDSESQLNELRRLLDRQADLPADISKRRLLRLSRALVTASVDEEFHAHCQDILAVLAAASLRGEQVVELYPEEIAHLDVCQQCAADFAVLMDDLQQLEEAVGRPLPVAPPLPSPLLSPLSRLAGWLKDLVHPLVERLDLDDAEGVDLALESYFSWLPEFSDPAVLRPAYETAMGFGGEGDQTLLLLIAGGFATDRLLGQFSAQEIQQLANSGQLNGIGERTATQVARQVQFDRRLRDEFVRAYVAHVQRDPEAFTTLFTRPNQAA